MDFALAAAAAVEVASPRAIFHFVSGNGTNAFQGRREGTLENRDIRAAAERYDGRAAT